MVDPEVVAFFFGATRASGGHTLYVVREGDPTVMSASETVLPTRLRNLDTAMCPGFDRESPTPREKQVEGVVRLLIHRCAPAALWTTLAWWDRSVDARFGSHATFGLRGSFSYAAGLEALRGFFPSTMGRFTYRLRPEDPLDAASISRASEPEPAPEHEWERLIYRPGNHITERMKVSWGWLVRVREYDCGTFQMSMCFIPDGHVGDVWKTEQKDELP